MVEEEQLHCYHLTNNNKHYMEDKDIICIINQIFKETKSLLLYTLNNSNNYKMQGLHQEVLALSFIDKINYSLNC